MSDLFSFEFGLTAVLSIIISNQYKLRLHQADAAGIGGLEGVRPILLTHRNGFIGHCCSV